MKPFLIFVALIISTGCKVQKAIPVAQDGIYIIAINNTILEVDPQTGGRIISLKMDGRNFLTGKEVNENYWGSTLWPSPQKEWGGKPPPELNNQPYSVRVEKNVVKMMSTTDSKFGYVFSKEIYGDTKENLFNIKYTITNKSDSVRKVSPWEVTRVHTKGVAFFPKGAGERWGNMAALAEGKKRITWFAYQEEKVPAKHQKFFADGSEGWIVQLDEDVLFIKKFTDISAAKAAPGEAEIEIYTNLDKSYVEIEQQGSYESLQPGESLVWEVKWFLRKVPAAINREAGSKALIAYVRSIVK